jgi:hypothetical protein
MAWLIYGTPLMPRFQPHFEWSGLSGTAVETIRAFKPVEDAPSAIVGTRTSLRAKILPPPDFFKGLGGWLVCDAFKEMVDDLEPHENQFFPVTLLDELGKVPLKYWLMNVVQAVDALNLEKSFVHANWVQEPSPSGMVKRISHWSLDPRPEYLEADRSVIAGKHIWRGAKHLRSYVLFSDALMARVAKLKRLVAYKVTEV